MNPATARETPKGEVPSVPLRFGVALRTFSF